MAGLQIATFLCPSDPGPWLMNYAGCHHDAEAAIAADNHGVLYLNSRVRYDEIADGLACTIMLGEINRDGPTLGWISGTRASLRNTGHPFSRAVYNSSRTTWPSTRDELFDYIGYLADDGSWPVDLKRRIHELSQRRSELSFLQRFSARSQVLDQPTCIPAAGRPQ